MNEDSSVVNLLLQSCWCVVGRLVLLVCVVGGVGEE